MLKNNSLADAAAAVTVVHGTEGQVKKKKPRRRRHRNPASTSDTNIRTVAKVPLQPGEASCNWKQLTQVVEKNPWSIRKPNSRRKKRGGGKDSGSQVAGSQNSAIITVDGPISIPPTAQTASPVSVVLNEFNFPSYHENGKCKTVGLLPAKYTKDTRCLAMDCEMVGVGPMKESALARVSVVNEMGYCVYDKFVKPLVEITDYRTPVSGIREEDMKKAEKLQIVIQEVAAILKGHILVGHALEHDLKSLFLTHPRNKIRDTVVYFKKFRRPALRMLTEKHLNVKIQTGEHNSITDAQAAMKLYLVHRNEWEQSIKRVNNARVKQFGRPSHSTT